MPLRYTQNFIGKEIGVASLEYDRGGREGGREGITDVRRRILCGRGASGRLWRKLFPLGFKQSKEFFIQQENYWFLHELNIKYP
jgi:hypothetical protein